MSEKPILFSGPMVQAILDGSKTVTRRVIKPQPYAGCWYEGIVDEYHQFYESRGGDIGHYLCPYGEPGDHLWVRETWRTCREDDGLKPSELDPENAGDLWWEADGSSRRRLNAKPGKVRPSIYMPRWASRITLRVKSVRVERVQEISAVDAMWEGIALAHNPINKLTIEALGNRSSTGLAVIEDFIALWDSINDKRGFGWHANPWVWVVEFEKVEVGE